MLIDLINKNITLLKEKQQKQGFFLSYSTLDKHSFKNAKKYFSIFPSSLILSCLSSLDETAELKLIKNKLTKFLLSQKSDHWSFNYWIRNSKQAKQLPYPDDLDDTFCVLAALYKHDSSLIDGAGIAKIVTLLTAVEKDEGGPYKTWLVPPNADKAWQDIDLAVNSNVAYFLSLQDINLPKIDSLVEGAIKNSDFHSPYYSSIYSVIYFISRWLVVGKKIAKKKILLASKLRKFIFSKMNKNGSWGNSLDTALAVSALLNLGALPIKLKKSVEHLLRQEKKGLWKAFPFVTELIKEKKVGPKSAKEITYAGSTALTVAFCLEAVVKYQKVLSGVGEDKTNVRKTNKEATKISKKVVKKARQRFSILEGDLRDLALNQLNKTLNGDKDQQIVLLPYFFSKSLGELGKKLDSDFLVDLGLVNLYGWIAYTIYDDFLDDEGDPRLLSLANLCLREVSSLYGGILPAKIGFGLFFQEVMDKLDAANTWEVSNCRFKQEDLLSKELENILLPEYGNYLKLAERSLGHALGPVAILFSLGFKLEPASKSKEIKQLMKFFEHYLIARQLNDDAHDWEKDLRLGHLNAVGVKILEQVRKSNKNKDNSNSFLKSSAKKIDYDLFQKIFWYEIAEGVCQDILKHARLAKKTLKQIAVIKKPELLESLLVGIERSAQKALKEREETLKFLSEYGG